MIEGSLNCISTCSVGTDCTCRTSLSKSERKMSHEALVSCRKYQPFFLSLSYPLVCMTDMLCGSGKFVTNNTDYQLVQSHWHPPSEHFLNGVCHGTSHGT